MLPSSNRVKLNRVALKDVFELKLAPQRRRPPKPEIKGSAKSTKQEKNLVSGFVLEEDEASGSGDSNEPCKTFLLHQLEPENGTGTLGDVLLGGGGQKAKRNELHFSPGDEMERNPSASSTRGKYERSKPNTRSSSRSEHQGTLCRLWLRCSCCRFCADSEVRSRVRPRVRIPGTFCRMKRTIAKKTPGTGFKSARFRAGKGRAGQSSTGSRPQPEPAAPQSGTPSELGPTPNINKNFNSNLNGLDDSGGLSRNSVEACTCVICGDSKYISPQRKNLGKQRLKSSNPGLEPPAAELNVSRETRILEMPEEMIVQEKQLPKVTLCDVAKKCDACCRKCGYVLPDLFKTKVVRCFKQDMKAGLQIWSRCSGHNRRDDVKNALVKNHKRRSNILNNNSVGRPQSLTGHQKRLEDTDLQAPSSPAELFHSGWTEERSETCSAALGDHQGDVTNVCVEEDTLHRDERLKRGDGVVCSSTVSSALEENHNIEKSCDQSRESIETQTSSDSSENHDTDDPESFTCQRVKPYVRKISYSCARTCMPWPFLNRQPTRTTQGSTSAGSVRSSPTENSLTRNQNQACSSTKQGKDALQDSSLEAQNGTSFSNLSSYSDTFPPSPQLDSVLFPLSSLHRKEPGVDTAPTSPFPVNSAEIDTSTPSPSALGLSDWETTGALSPLSVPLTQDALRSISKTSGSLPPVDSQQTASTSSSPVPSSNSSRSCVSPSLLQQHRNDAFYTESPPKLKPYYASPVTPTCSVLCDLGEEFSVEMDLCEFRLPPVLSPITSPQCRSWRRSLSYQSSRSSEEEELFDKNANRTATSPESHTVQTVNGNNENSKDFLEHIPEEMEVVSSNFRALTDVTEGKPQSSSKDDEDVGLDYSDYKDKVEESSKSPEQVQPEPRSPLSSDEEDRESFRDEEEHHSPGEEGCREIHESEADDYQSDVLDEFTAYEQDILLVGVTQDDPELFQNLPKQSLLKLGPVRQAVESTSKKVTFSTRIGGSSSDLEHIVTPVPRHFPGDSPDFTEESDSRPWRPRCSTTLTKIQNSYPAADKQTRHVGQSDANNNQVDGNLESTRGHFVQTLNSHISPLKSSALGPWLLNSAKVADIGCHKSNAYCRGYFSESPTCEYKNCRFQHLPMKGHEKFCVEQVTKFIKIPVCLKKAGEIFTGYYQSSPPGMYFSMPVLLSLLWAQLKAGMVLDVFSVLGVSLAHNLTPDHEFLLALFNFVRDKNLMGFVPKLMELTSKMVGAGLELSLDCLECVKNTPLFQQKNLPVPALGKHKFCISTPIPKYLNLAHVVVEMGLCTKQEDWKRMGEVFKTLCQYSQHPNQVERISGCVAIGLLSESKDKNSLPFAVFAETVCQNGSENSLLKTFVGRIGVSLMLRYHKNHQWAKGRRVVEVMSASKVNYSTVKGLFGNEDRASRCYLVTVATELFLLSGSVEGALNTLRENNWFLSSGSWPCEPADLESRTRLLMALAEQVSHRDTLEALSHLPGIKEPNDLIDVSRYSPKFSSLLQVCVEKQILPVASDTVDLMLCKNLPVEHSVLQTLIHKLGKQNLWLRAREVFKRSQNLGYYSEVSAPPGLMSLTVPCRLGEMELVLAFEMFITVNASVIRPPPETTTAPLSITLKRTQSSESDYISAGSRVLSAAGIPRPKLAIHYTTVNSSQEQVFTLDVSSARRWLHHNHLWANDLWTH